MLKIKLTHDNEPLNELAQRYWAIDSAGNWLETTDILSASFGIPKHKLIKQINQIATTYFIGTVCNCGNELVVTNRTGFKRLLAKKSHTCDSCLQKDEELRQKNLHEAEQKRLELIEHFLKTQIQSKYNFLNLTFTNAVYCQVILDAAGVTADMEFGPISQLFITPNDEDSRLIFSRLLHDGIIKFGLSSPHSAFEFPLNEENSIRFSIDQVNWLLSEPDLCCPLDGYLQEIISHPDAESLCALWLEIALQECKACFYEQCERYRLRNWEFTSKLKEAIKYALRFYSIPQVWNHIFHVAKDLAALVQAGAYNKKHIENMFSGNLKRRVDKFIANAWDVKPWGRRAYEKKSYLTSFLFDNLFGGGDNDWQTITASNVGIRAAEVASRA